MVGVVHDTDGYPVSGATVILHAADGGAIGNGTTAGDGTFAVEENTNVAAVEVRCAYCLRMTVTAVPGRPVVAVVRRFAALRDRGISAADARVLPYASATDLASLLPFAVTTHGTISDRGLAGARGTVIADGIPLYRATDGVDLGTAIPAHGTATIGETDPTQANADGANSADGFFSIDTLDQPAGLARADAGSAVNVALRGGNLLRGAFETAGGTDAATRGVLDGTLSTAAGTLDLRAVAASGMSASANGFASTLVTPLRTASLISSLSMAQSSDANGPENDSLAALTLQNGNVTYGVRGQRAAGFFEYGTGVQYDARAFIQTVHDDGHTRIFASLAAAQDGDALGRYASANAALLPILSVATHLAPEFVLHADSVDALLAVPLYLINSVPSAVSRSHLLDAGLGFDDGNRIRVDAMLFRQTVTGQAYGTTGGSGISAVWQIAPSLALRSWTLISKDNGYEYATYGTTSSLDRNVAWLTAGNVLRVDAIWRGNNLEGDISIPAGAHARLVAGTRRDGPNRVLTAGVSWP